MNTVQNSETEHPTVAELQRVIDRQMLTIVDVEAERAEMARAIRAAIPMLLDARSALAERRLHVVDEFVDRVALSLTKAVRPRD